MPSRTIAVFIVCALSVMRSVAAVQQMYTTELIDDTFEEYLRDNELVIVMYFDPFQQKSRGLLPVFSSLVLAPIFEKKGIRVARISSKANSQIAHKYRVIKTPSFALFSGGIQIRFEEKFSQRRMIEFVRNQLLFKVDHVASIEEAKPSSDFSVYYYSQNEESLLARTMRGIKRKHFSIQVFKLDQPRDGSSDDQLIVKRDHDNYFESYNEGTNSPQRIERIIIEAEYPDFSVYSDKTQEWLDREGLPIVAVLMGTDDISSKGPRFLAAKAAVKDFKHVVIAVFIDRSSTEAPLLKEFSQVDLSQVLAIIISPAKPYHKKYILKKEDDTELQKRLIDFLEKFETDSLPRYYLSQMISDVDQRLSTNLAVLTSEEVHDKLITRFDQVACVLLHSGDSLKVGCSLT